MTKEDIFLLRKKLKMSQEEFGKSIGLSKSGISNIESGKRRITPQHQLLIKAVFGQYIGKLDLSKIPTNELLAELKRRCD